MEQRVATLEAHFQHMHADVSDLKTSLRRMNDKVDAVERTLTERIDSVQRAVNELCLRIERFKLWAILLYIGGMGGLLLVLARGFKWL